MPQALPHLEFAGPAPGAPLREQAAAAVQTGPSPWKARSTPRTSPFLHMPAPFGVELREPGHRRRREPGCAGCATIPCRASPSSSMRSGSRWVAAPRRRHKSYWRPLIFMLPTTPSLPRDAGGVLAGLHLGADPRRSVLDLHLRLASRAALSRRSARASRRAATASSPSSGRATWRLRNRSNDYLLDREEQKDRSFTPECAASPSRTRWRRTARA
jgi:hypothetical protein